MSLVKKPTMTEEKLAANRANGALSQGATGEAKKHSDGEPLSVYAKAEHAALSCLGEDPARFEEMLEGLYQEFQPRGVLQEALVKRLARALWLMERADRSQDGQAMSRARTADRGRDNRLHARMMRLKMTAETLRSLARSLAVRHYVTTRDDLEVIKKLHQEGAMTDMGDIALDLFYQLQEPGTDQDGVSEQEKRRRVVNSMRSIFGLGEINSPVDLLTPAGKRLVVEPEGYEEAEADPGGEEGEDTEQDDRYPSITAEDWEVRERARKLLKNILTRQAEGCEALRKALLRESLAGPSPYELTAEFSPSLADAWLMSRTQDAGMREVRRLTNLLLKLRRLACEAEPCEVGYNASATQDVLENKDT